MKKTILLFCSGILLAASSYGAAAAEESGATVKRTPSFLKNHTSSYWKLQQEFAHSLGMPAASRTLDLDPNPSMTQHPRLNASIVRKFNPLLPFDAYENSPLSFFSESKAALPFPAGPAHTFLYFHCQAHAVDIDQVRDVWGEYTDKYKTKYTSEGPFELQEGHRITLIHKTPEKIEEIKILSLNKGVWKGILEVSPQSTLSFSLLEVPVPGWASSRVLSSIEMLIVPTADHFIKSNPDKELQAIISQAQQLGL